jgi:hypothetical protein
VIGSVAWSNSLLCLQAPLHSSFSSKIFTFRCCRFDHWWASGAHCGPTSGRANFRLKRCLSR